MNKYLFGVVTAFSLLVSFAQDAKAQDAKAGWLFRGRCGSYYFGPTCYAPPNYPSTFYYPSCGYVIVSPPVVVDQKGATQKQAPSFQDLPQKKVDPPKVIRLR